MQQRRPKNLSLAEAVAWHTPTGLSPDDCWPWMASVNNRGYGQLRRDGGTVTAHRAAWRVAHGRELAPNEQVRHRCDNRRCVNPAHLEAGTALENSGDMVARGRSMRGSRQNFARLTEAAIPEIRAMYAAGIRCETIADTFDVSVQTIYHVVARRTWKHVA